MTDRPIVQELLAQLTQKDIIQINMLLPEGLFAAISSCVVPAFDKAFSSAILLQSEKYPRKTMYVTVSLLLASLEKQRVQYQIDVYEKQGYMGKSIGQSVFDVTIAFDELFECRQSWDEQRAFYRGKITSNDLDELVARLVQDTIDETARCLQHHIERIIKLEAYQVLAKEPNVYFGIGGYRGQTSMFFHDYVGRKR